MVDLYSYIVTMMHMYQRMKNIIDYLKSSVLFYLYYSLYIRDNTSMVIAQNICYNLNLFDNDSTNILELNMKIKVFADITNIQKNIHKIVFIGDLIDIDIEFGNYSDFVYHFDKLSTFYKKLILTIN